MNNGVYNVGKTRVMPKGRPFQKGNHASPGRPKNALLIPDVLRAIGDEPVPAVLLAQLQASWGPDFKPANMRDAALRVTYAQYAKGDPAARQFVAERTEGKITDKLILDDQTPREVIFKEVRIGEVSMKEPVAIVRTITREPKA